MKPWRCVGTLMDDGTYRLLCRCGWVMQGVPEHCARKEVEQHMTAQHYGYNYYLIGVPAR